MFVTELFVSLALLSSSSSFAQQTASSDARSTAPLPSAAKSLSPDPELEAYRARLFDLAIDTASSMPLVPHVKNRSRAQQAVVDAALELGQTRLALNYAERIANWRRGVVYADVGFELARRGDADEAQRWLGRAHEVALSTEDETDLQNVGQDWRREHIRSRIARTYIALGHTQQANMFSDGLSEAEMGVVLIERARALPKEAFESHLAALESAVGSGSFEATLNAFGVCVQLFEELYEDVERRTLVRAKLREFAPKIAPAQRIEFTERMVEAALARADRETAGSLLDEAASTMASARWRPEDEAPLRARLAMARHRAGATTQAQRELETAAAVFESSRASIQNFERAETLRPIAEARRVLGDTEGALRDFKRCVVDGAENPNARQRAEDLAATCAVLALRGIEPDPELWKLLIEQRGLLTDPW